MKKVIFSIIFAITIIFCFCETKAYAEQNTDVHYNDVLVGTHNYNNTTYNSAKLYDQLIDPEIGWNRYDNSNEAIHFSGTRVHIGGFNDSRTVGKPLWHSYINARKGYYKSTYTEVGALYRGASIKFEVNGSAFRMIGPFTDDQKQLFDHFDVYVDNRKVGETYGSRILRKLNHEDFDRALLYQYTFRYPGYHTVEFVGICNDRPTGTGKIYISDGWFNIDAIDVKGELLGVPNSIIPDPNLRSVLSGILNKNGSDISKDDLKKITSIDAANKGIKSLEGLENCSNLESINLSGNEVSDLTPLAKSGAKIKYINLDNNKVSNLLPLSNLTNLECLYIPNNKISNLSALKNLKNLKQLYVYRNNISDISCLEDMTNLEELSIAFSNVSNITPISKLTNLRRLYLNNNNITDISVLSNLTDLEYLGLAYNEINDISVVKNLTNLKELAIDNNNVSDISSVKHLTSLTYLSLANNNITDITSLTGLTKLNALYLYGCKIKDISALENLKELKILHLYNNEIKDFTPINNLNITDLKIENQRV